MKIDIEDRRIIVDVILTLPNLLGRYADYEGILTFLNRIWDIREIAPVTPGFHSAAEEIRHNMIASNEWSYGYLLYERLGILGVPEDVFINFVETWIAPDVRNDRMEMVEFASTLNTALSHFPLKLTIVDYFEGLPIYRLKLKSENRDLPPDLVKNDIPIYKAMIYASQFPCLQLQSDNWDDYSYKTLFKLYYHSTSSNREEIGSIKILHATANITWDTLENEFYSLDSDYCSLGQDDDYYHKLKAVLGSKYQSVALALRDCALFPKIQEPFESTVGFEKSLLRWDTANSALKTIRYDLNGLTLDDCFKFSYTYKPPYSDEVVNLNFDFNYTAEVPQRVYALIGKNGTGKTTLMASLAQELRDFNSINILPKNPLHSKIFAISYSFFDRFSIPQSDASFNYVYCGLRKLDGGFLTQDEICDRALKTANRIIEQNRVPEWFFSLKEFITDDILSVCFVQSFHRGRFIGVSADLDHFREFFFKLSSGQNILVFVVGEVIAQIRPYSLILYDEPETHLHPNAISNLMTTIFFLVNNYKSFCVIATHSPIIVQELPSKCVLVLDRDNDLLNIRRLEKESFGENLTVITDEIFGASQGPKNFHILLRKLVDEGKSYEQIVDLLKNESLPVSLNTRLLVKSLIKQR